MRQPRRDIWEVLNLDYFATLHAFRRWKRYLSYAVAFAAIGWVSWAAWRGDESMFSSGPISVGHVSFGDDCMRCHIPGRGYRYFWGEGKAAALNGNCLICHGPTIGHDAETKTAWHQLTEGQEGAALHAPPGERTLACSSCHAEHEGTERLIDMTDNQCVRCHADLNDQLAHVAYDATISTFDAHKDDPEQSHPEFRIIARNTPDPGRIRFNHRRHMSTEEPMLGPNGQHYRLRCDDCHRAGDSKLPWRFGRARPHQEAGTAVAESELHLQEDYMAPINFDLHCSGCHKLTVGLRIDQLRGNETAPAGGVPHSTPAAIRSYVRGELNQYINDPDHPPTPAGAQERTPLPKLSGESQPQKERLKLEWIETELRRIELQLYGQENQACRHCHELAQSWPRMTANALPVIVRPIIPKRWFKSASFSHEKHKALPGPPPPGARWGNCVECHTDVLKSEATRDVLLPGISNCRKCHAPYVVDNGVVSGGVSHSCVFCHTFHRPPAIEPLPEVAAAGD